MQIKNENKKITKRMLEKKQRKLEDAYRNYKKMVSSGLLAPTLTEEDFVQTLSFEYSEK